MPTSRRDPVVVGASAGGVEVLRTVVSALPPDVPAAVLVTMHLPAGTQSALARVLDRVGAPLPAQPARHGAPTRPGVVYVALPDRHLLTEDGAVVLTQGPTENGHRPAINATFRSAASTALSLVDTEHVVRAGALPPSEQDSGSGYTCPDCQGSLTEVGPEGGYRCRIGHAWSGPALPAAHDGEFRFALQKALRALDEKAGLARKPSGPAERYAASAAEATSAADTLRRFLLDATGETTYS